MVGAFVVVIVVDVLVDFSVVVFVVLNGIVCVFVVAFVVVVVVVIVVVVVVVVVEVVVVVVVVVVVEVVALVGFCILVGLCANVLGRADGFGGVCDVTRVVCVTMVRAVDGIRVGVADGSSKPSTTSPSIGISLSLSNSRLCSVTAASTPLGSPSGKCDSKKVCMKLSGSKPDPSPSRSKSSAVMKSGNSSPSGSFNLFD